MRYSLSLVGKSIVTGRSFVRGNQITWSFALRLWIHLNTFNAKHIERSAGT